MHADTCLTYDLDERWVVHTIKCGDVYLGTFEDFLDPCRAVAGALNTGGDHNGDRFDAGRRDGGLFHDCAGFDGFRSPDQITAVVQLDDRVNP